MDDANVGRDTTMYHSVTACIQVLDNHEEPLFWTNVLKHASHVKVEEEDIQEIKRLIQKRIIGVNQWNLFNICI